MLSDEHRRPLTDLVFLQRGPLLIRVLCVVVAAAGAAIAGFEIVRLQEHFAAQLAGGVALNPFEAMLGRGSRASTAAAGWVAAVLFTLALVRLRRDPLEPAPSLRSIETQTVHQLRRGLRREYAVIRIAFVAVLLVAAVDTSRVLSIAVLMRRGDSLLAGSFATTVVEAAGLAVAAAVLALWAKLFSRRLQRLAAL